MYLQKYSWSCLLIVSNLKEKGMKLKRENKQLFAPVATITQQKSETFALVRYSLSPTSLLLNRIANENLIFELCLKTKIISITVLVRNNLGLNIIFRCST